MIKYVSLVHDYGQMPYYNETLYSIYIDIRQAVKSSRSPDLFQIPQIRDGK